MKKTKELTREDAMEIYSQLNEAGQQQFKEKYKEFFEEQGYEAACKKLALDPKEELPYSSAKTKRQKKLNAFTQLDIQREAIGEYPGIEDRKWYPIFKVTPSGLVFSHTLYEYWYSYSSAYVGAPFVFSSSDQAAEFGESNVSLYNEIFSK